MHYFYVAWALGLQYTGHFCPLRTSVPSEGEALLACHVAWSPMGTWFHYIQRPLWRVFIVSPSTVPYRTVRCKYGTVQHTTVMFCSCRQKKKKKLIILKSKLDQQDLFSLLACLFYHTDGRWEIAGTGRRHVEMVGREKKRNSYICT